MEIEWREILFGVLLLAFLILVPSLLFGRFFLWAWTRWRPKSKPRRVFVYAASFAVWLAVVLGLGGLFEHGLLYLYAPPTNPAGSVLGNGEHERMPVFPWPPPLASSETTIPRNWFPDSAVTRLADVAEKIEAALEQAKYPKWSYSSVPKGFALVSQMEQIKFDGTPSPSPARWASRMPEVTNMTLLEFIKALGNAQPGYYRVIVFVVTNQPWPRTGEKPTGKEAEQWLVKGFTWLPERIGKLPYGPDYRTTVLVYEFKKVSQDVDATFRVPSPISADDHLKKAGLFDPLSRH